MMLGYVGLGSNVEPRRQHLRAGIAGLCSAGLEPAAVSSVWETEPVDSPDPRWFLNMVVALRTERAPLELLELLLAIERRLGRVRAVPNGPRTLDLDLLLLGAWRWHDARLQLPHPRLWSRRFVLEPLAEIAPGLCNPATGRTVAEECRGLCHRARAVRRGPLGLAGIIRPFHGSIAERSRP